MKAIFINAKDKTVKDIDFVGDFCTIGEMVGNIFTSVNLGNGETLYVDDEGMLKHPCHLFNIAHYPRDIAGNGLILGITSSGESTDTSMTAVGVSAGICWASRYNIDFAKMKRDNL